MSFQQWLSMGGYGFYVWAAYGMTALLLAGEVLYLIQQRRARLRTLRRLARMNRSESR